MNKSGPKDLEGGTAVTTQKIESEACTAALTTVSTGAPGLF